MSICLCEAFARTDGPLQIDREYLKLGMRRRSQEIATRELGPRLEPEMLHARERVIRKEQWTEIDRSLQRKADESGLVSYEQFQPRSDAARVRAEQDIGATAVPRRHRPRPACW